MRKIVLAFLSLIFVVPNVKAETDADFYAKVYAQVQDEYLFETSLSALSEKALSGLTVIDPKLKLADNEFRTSLYYDGKSYRNVTKPQDLKSVKAWGEFTQKVVVEAMKTSPEIKAKDFEIKDYLLLAMFSDLDKDTKYYPYLDLGEKRDGKKQRYFADRYLPDDVLYMKFGPMNFYTKERILQSLDSHPNYRALIVDLRGNPGGVLSESIEIMNIFLDEGVIVSTQSRKIGSHTFYVAEGVNVVKSKPMVVLVDGDTASSAEVLASAMNLQLGATIVGTQTKGKGTVQKLIKFDNGGEVALTSAYYYIPSGESLQNRGIAANICMLEMGENENPDEVINNLHNKVRTCPRESRAKYEIDIVVAQELLKN
ncbi:MAG: S41 family peptidase [Alphaproteobacteria bacterium]|nr:S41 family peptidase [Alphaproteobacteria bacterium]